MLTQILWWSGNVILACLLARAVKDRFFAKYLVFYFYLSHVLLLMLLRFYFYVFKPSAYRAFWWDTQIISVAIGYCVIWEIYQQALAAYPGTLRMARCLIWALFLIVVAKALSGALSDPAWVLANTVGELERNLRAVQAGLLFVVLSLLTYYVIPIGRNLQGIILGYGFFVGTGVINYSLRSQLGERFQLWWRYSQSIAWLVTLLIWSVTLWSYHPNPKPETEIEIERDYELFSARTAQAVAKARGYLLRAVRS